MKLFRNYIKKIIIEVFLESYRQTIENEINRRLDDVIQGFQNSNKWRYEVTRELQSEHFIDEIVERLNRRQIR